MTRNRLDDLNPPDQIKIDEYINLYSDPFSDVTKRNRRSLFTFSVVAIFLGYLDVQPSKIPALGISEIPEVANSFLPIFLFICIVFQISAFSIHAYNDWFWNKIRKENFDRSFVYSSAYDRLMAEISAYRIVNHVTEGSDGTSTPTENVTELPQEIADKIDDLSVSGFTKIVSETSERVGSTIAKFRFLTDFLAPILIGISGLFFLFPKIF